MTLQIYADESGAHNPRGERPGTEVAVLAGYIASRDEWKSSSRDWNAVLTRYKVAYFHAHEFERRSKDSANQYHSWNQEKAERFKFALAEIAGRHIPIGGGYNVKEHHKLNRNDKTYVYAYPIKQFFNDLIEAVADYGYSKERLSIVFDLNTGKKWNAAIVDEIEFWGKNGIEIVHKYGDDRTILPLQVADLYAHRARILHTEQLQKQAESGKPVRISPTVFDTILNRRIRAEIGFTPVITPELRREAIELSQRHSSVRRALSEIPNGHFKFVTKRNK